MKNIITISAALLLFALNAGAQKGNIGFIYPAGAQKGTTVEVTVGGQGLSAATGILFGGEGVTGELIKPEGRPAKKKGKNKDIGEEDNLQLADQVRFRVTVAKDAVSGIRDVRIVTEKGLTNRLYFEVGELPDVIEDGKAALSASSATLPVTFNGQVMRSDVDRFRFHANRGMQLVLRVKGRVFVPYMADAVPGWFQPVIRLYGPDGKEVAFSDDYTFHVDPVLFYKVQQGGDYEVEINDALYRGREDFVYRIDVGELPYITSISPVGGKVGSKTTVQLTGFNLGAKSVQVKPSEAGMFPVSVTTKKGISSNVMWFDASAMNPAAGPVHPSTRESASRLLVGEVAEAVIREPMEQHWYSLDVFERGPLDFKVLSRHLGTPADIRMTIFDAQGNLVKDVDDTEDSDDYMTTHFADPRLTLGLRPGAYLVRITESQGHSGPEYAYRFSVDRAAPDFSVNIEPSTISVPEDGTGIFNVFVTRKQRFNGPVDLSVEGLPKGFKVAGTHIEGNQKKSIVTVTAPSGAEHQVIHPKVVATATKRDMTIKREAVPVESMMQAFYYTHLMPIDDFRLEVGETQPFKMKVVKDWKGERLVLSRTGNTMLKVKLERDPGFDSSVTLMLRSSDGGVKSEAVVIPEGESEGVLELVVKSKNKRTMDTRFAVVAVVKGSSKKLAGQGRRAYVASVTAYTPAVEARIPGLAE